MFARFLTSLFALTLFVLPAFAQSWALYTNPTDGSSLEVPRDLFDNVEQSEEGGGVVFSNERLGVSLTIYSIDNSSGLSLAEVKKLVAEGDERDITYERRKRNWFVLSGYETSKEDGTRDVFYSRLAANRDRSRFAAFELVYPEAVRDRVDPLVRRISLSLKAPRR